MAPRNNTALKPDLSRKLVAVISAVLYVTGAACLCSGTVVASQTSHQAGSLVLIAGVVLVSVGRLASCGALDKHRWLVVLSWPLEVSAVILLLILGSDDQSNQQIYWICSAMIATAILIHAGAVGLAYHLNKNTKLHSDIFKHTKQKRLDRLEVDNFQKPTFTTSV